MSLAQFRRWLSIFGSVGDGAVDTAQLAADAVDGTKLADDAVDSEHIADAAVLAAHIDDGAVGRDALAVYASAGATRRVPMQSWRKNTLVPLAATADGTVLGLAGGTYGTNGPRLIGSVANANAKSEVARLLWTIPPEYVAGSNLLFRFRTRVNGTAHVSQTIDLSVRKVDAEGGIGADICATAAQAIPAAWDLIDFTVTGTSLGAGDELDIQLTLAVDDTGGTLNKEAEVGCVIIGCPETY